MNEPYLQYLLEGKKTVESRFSLHRIAPYKKVGIGDVVFLKSGSIIGYFIVDWVKYVDLTRRPIITIKRQYNDAICGNDEFWKEKSAKKYVSLLGVSGVQSVTPFRIDKHDRRAWISL